MDPTGSVCGVGGGVVISQLAFLVSTARPRERYCLGTHTRITDTTKSPACSCT